MFSIGDIIVYPGYGAGRIVDIESIVSSGVINYYYILDIKNGNLKIRVSEANSKGIGLRGILTKDEVGRAVKEAFTRPIKQQENWNLRYKDNLSKIKTGCLESVLEVYRSLSLREMKKGLSSVEKRMLMNVRHIVLSELVISMNTNKKNAEEYLAKALLG